MIIFHLGGAVTELNEGFKSSHSGYGMFGGKPDLTYMDKSKREGAKQRELSPERKRWELMHTPLSVLVAAAISYLVVVQD